jgi:hypothetical protein
MKFGTCESQIASRQNLSLVGARGKRATERVEKGALMS